MAGDRSVHRVVLVSAVDFLDLDEDLTPLGDALHRAGVQAEVACWDDPDVDWSTFGLAVLRSPWDYAGRYEEFLAWLDGAQTVTSVLNHPDVVRWNTDKRYLVALAAAGVAVVPTHVGEPGDHLPEAWFDGEVVVKPVVSAGSKDTVRHTRPAAARRHAQALLDAGRAVLVQPYQAGVDVHGETAMVFFDSELSHGLRKGPILAADAPPTDDPFAEELMSSRQPTDAELALARAALAAAPADLLYARVDCIPGPDAAPVLLELELAEPSFFVRYAPGSADRFAACVARRLA